MKQLITIFLLLLSLQSFSGDTAVLPRYYYSADIDLVLKSSFPIGTGSLKTCWIDKDNILHNPWDNDTTKKRIVVATPAIEINIPDFVQNGTRYKRKARLFTMTYNQNSQTVALSFVVTSYADSSGKYGAVLKEIPSYTRETVADNSTAVNPANGAILVKDKNGGYSIDWMGQYDFFWLIGQNTPVKIHSLILQYGQQIKW